MCLAPSPPLAFMKNGYPIHRCATCEVVFSSRPPGGEKLEELYSAEYFTEGGAGYPDYIADERTHRRQARSYLKKNREARDAAGALARRGMRRGLFPRRGSRGGMGARGLSSVNTPSDTPFANSTSTSCALGFWTASSGRPLVPST